MLDARPTPLLLAVIGSSPQVLTETLFGIYQRKQALPQVIKVITTLHGKQRMIDHDMFGANGRVNQFTQEYALPSIAFNLEDVMVIKDKNGVELEDARSLNEHTDMADFIIEVVRDLTSQVIESDKISNHELNELGILIEPEQHENAVKEYLTAIHKNKLGFKSIAASNKAKQQYFFAKYDKYSIHASIAGGRKSMTFLLGYAISLFARRHDRLSHVLVDPLVESSPKFFYPSKESKLETIVNRGKEQQIDFSTMQVELAEIPIVSLREKMPESMLSESLSYSATVKFFNELQQEPKLVLNKRLHIEKSDEHNREKIVFKVQCGNSHVNLELVSMCYLLAFASTQNPVQGTGNEGNAELGLLMFSYYASLLEQRDIQFSDHAQGLEWLNTTQNLLVKTETAIGKINLKLQLDKIAHNRGFSPSDLGGIANIENISKLNNKLKEELKSQIGPLAERYVPEKLKGQSSTRYVLNVKAENILVVDE